MPATLTAGPGKCAGRFLPPGALFLAGAVLFFAPGPVSPARAGETVVPTYSVSLEAPAPHAETLRRNLEIYRWQGSPRLNHAFLERIYRATPTQIENILAVDGYFSPRIEHSASVRGNHREFHFRVDPGRQGIVSRVSLDFRGEIMERPGTLPRVADLPGRWLLPAGEPFRRAGWEEAKRSLLDEFLRRNYPAASIARSRARVDPDRNEVSLEVVVASGPFVTMGDLEITGLERYPEKIVRNLNFIPRGTPHDRDYLFRFQDILLGSGYFSSAFVHVAVDPENPLETPVFVRVEERKRHRVESGLEYNTNTGPGLSLAWRRLNFLSPGWQLRNTLEIDPTRWQLGGGITLPPAGRGIIHDFYTSYLDEEREGLERAAFRLGFSRTRRLENRERVFSVEHQDERRPGNAGRVVISRALFLNNSLTVDRTDNRVFPTRGFLFNLQGGGAPGWFLSDRSFARAYGRVHRYFPLTDSDILILKGEAGAVLASRKEGIPTDYLFRAGGTASVRGYPYQSLGVKRDGRVEGALYMVTAGLEYNRWWRRWGMALFTDWGNASDELEGLSPVGSFGAGLRARTPVGVLNLDTAWGLERKSLAWHVSLGLPF